MVRIAVVSSLIAVAEATPVPAGKAIIETRSTGGLVQCYNGPESKVNSQFTIDQDSCYGPGYSSIATFPTDQTVHCSPEGYEDYIRITTFNSKNGKCTDKKGSSLHKKDACLGLPGDAIFIRCPESVKDLSTAKPNIVELAESVPALSTLVAAVVAGDLADTLSSAGPFTVFAPTNDAFAALPAGVVDSLMKPENKAQLVDILTYHVVPAQVLSKDLAPFQAVKTVEGNKLHIQKWGGQVRVGPSLKSTDLKKVTAADNLASNGVAHIIDGVLLPPTAPTPPAPKAKNIVELAQSVPSLSTLVTAVVAGDLASTLSSPGPFTVFAPTNKGFGKLPKGTVDSLLKPENKATLVDILTYHVLPSQVLSSDIKSQQLVRTVEGKGLFVSKHKGIVYLKPQGSRHLNTVTQADNKASNGVVHIIDGVLKVPAQVLV